MKILGAAGIGFADYSVVFAYCLIAIATISFLLYLDLHKGSSILLILSIYDENSGYRATQIAMTGLKSLT
jgi:hypothetical protein